MRETALNKSFLFPVKMLWLSYPEPSLCYCRWGHKSFLRSFCSTHNRVSSTVPHCISYLWASRQQRTKQSVGGLTLSKEEKTMHIQKCAMKTNAEDIWVGEVADYMSWHFLHNWKCIAHRQDGNIPSSMPPRLSSLVRQALQVWSQIWKIQESISYVS